MNLKQEIWNPWNYVPDGSKDEKNIEIIIDAWKILNIDQNTESKKIRESFKERIDSRYYTFKERVLVSLAYDSQTKQRQDCYKNLGEGKYKVIRKDQFYYSLVGNVSMIMKNNFSDEQLFEQVDEYDRTCLYIAARSGYFELCRYFFDRLQQDKKIKEYLNKVQKNGSTALHASSFYGQKQIVKLLMAYQADLDIKNKYENSALDESKDDQIKDIFTSSYQDNISKFYCKNQHLVYQIKQYNFGFRLERKINEKGFFEFYKNIIKNYKHTFHGTKLKHAESILQTGLRIPGQKDAKGKKIEIPKGHFSENVEINGIKNWAQAIFVSPSPFYAAEQCYSEHFESDSKTYCVVFETFVDPSSQIEKYFSTLSKREFDDLEEETKNVELRVNKIEYGNKDEKTSLSVSLQESEMYRVPIINKSEPVLTAALLFLDFSVLKEANNSKEYINQIINSLNL